MDKLESTNVSSCRMTELGSETTTRLQMTLMSWIRDNEKTKWWTCTYLIVRSCRPVGKLCRIGDVLLEPVSSEGAKANGSSTVQGSNLPESRGRHLLLSD